MISLNGLVSKSVLGCCRVKNIFAKKLVQFSVTASCMCGVNRYAIQAVVGTAPELGRSFVPVEKEVRNFMH